jgi:hypothetical protein
MKRTLSVLVLLCSLIALGCGGDDGDGEAGASGASGMSGGSGGTSGMTGGSSGMTGGGGGMTGGSGGASGASGGGCAICEQLTECCVAIGGTEESCKFSEDICVGLPAGAQSAANMSCNNTLMGSRMANPDVEECQ